MRPPRDRLDRGMGDRVGGVRLVRVGNHALVHARDSRGRQLERAAVDDRRAGVGGGGGEGQRSGAGLGEAVAMAAVADRTADGQVTAADGEGRRGPQGDGAARPATGTACL